MHMMSTENDHTIFAIFLERSLPSIVHFGLRLISSWYLS